MKTFAGIDLGTTYSALAVLNDQGKPEVVPNLAGDRLTPSVVWFPQEQEDVARVGAEAKQMVAQQPERVVQFVKRHMGEPAYRFSAGGREWSAVEISALILRKLKEECVQRGEASDVIVTVPAHFDEVQRKATMEAGLLAGLNVLGLINEPTAAALYYASSHEMQGNVLVYDLGGGTFDVTVLEIKGTEVRILTSKGDGYLGGIDFDRTIVRHYDAEHRAAHGTPLLPEAILLSRANATPPDAEVRELYQRLLDLAEKDKRALGARPQITRVLTTPAGETKVTLTRERFEELISAYVAKTEMLVENALEDAKLRPRDVQATLLVGGSTRVPVFARSLEQLMGIPPLAVVNVDEAVALGAALAAGKRIQERSPRALSPVVSAEVSKTRLTDVCNHYFGVLVLDRRSGGHPVVRNTIMLRKNTPLPCSENQVFSTVQANQRSVLIRITQTAEYETDPDYARQIGQFQVPLPPNCPAGFGLKLRYTYDTDQRLHCEAVLANGRSFEGTLQLDGQNATSQSELREKQQKLEKFTVE
jgi:molecular chaperone DnaK